MSILRYEIEYSWGARQQPLDRDVDALFDFLARLGALHPPFVRWALAPVDLAKPRPLELVDLREKVAEAYALAERRWTHGDTEYSAHEVRLVSDPALAPSAEIALTAGITQPSTTVDFANACRFRFWGPGRVETVNEPSLVRAFVFAGVSSFAPRWTSCGPKGWPERSMDDLMDGKPPVAWMLHVSPPYGMPSPVPPPGWIEPAPDGGTLVCTVNEWFDPTRPEHVDQAARVRAQLSAEGVLRPAVILVPDA